MNPMLKWSIYSVRLSTTPTTKPFKKRIIARLCKLTFRKPGDEDVEVAKPMEVDVLILVAIMKAMVMLKVTVGDPLAVDALQDATIIVCLMNNLITSVMSNIKHSYVKEFRGANYKVIMLILMLPLLLCLQWGVQSPFHTHML